MEHKFQGNNSPDTTKFPDNSLMTRGTPAHFNWYSTRLT